MNKSERGHQANQLLANSLLQESLAALTDQYVQSWRQAKTVEAREDCHRYVMVIDKFQDHLRSIATTGEIERADIAALEGRKRFAWTKM